MADGDTEKEAGAVTKKFGVVGKASTLEDLTKNLPPQTPVSDIANMALSTSQNEVKKSVVEKKRED